VAKTASLMLCRKEGIAQRLYYSWPREFLEAGKRLAGHTARQARSGEVKDLRAEATAQKLTYHELRGTAVTQDALADVAKPILPPSPGIA
jgi:hypothetical protein